MGPSEEYRVTAIFPLTMGQSWPRDSQIADRKKQKLLKSVLIRHIMLSLITKPDARIIFSAIVHCSEILFSEKDLLPINQGWHFGF